MPDRLFGRDYSITVGSLELTGLRCNFQATKTIKAEPNTCQLQVYNLNEDHRHQLEQASPLNASAAGVPVRIEAGYKNQLSQIYFGEVRYVWTKTDGPDLITSLSTGDGEKAAATSRLYVPIGPRTPPDIALQNIASALGIGLGNLQQAKGVLATKGVATLYSKGTILAGSAAQILNDFCRSADLEWSIQDQKLQILDRGKALDGLAVELSSDTGLVGSPEIDNKGVVKATCLMIPDLKPGRKVSFAAKHLKGGFRITKVEYSGDTFGQDWYAKIEAEKY